MHLPITRANNLELPLDLQLKLFDNTVLPILTYDSEVWGYENLDIIERIHTDFLRRIIKCRKGTPRLLIYTLRGDGQIPVRNNSKTKDDKFLDPFNYWQNIKIVLQHIFIYVLINPS